MSTTTAKFGLVKPELTDSADITAMNPNWDKIDNELSIRNLKTYTTLEQIGLTTGNETIETIINAMANLSYLQCATTSANNMSIYPSDFGGTLIVEKSYGNRAKLTYFTQTNEWVGYYYNGTWNGWNLTYNESNPPIAYKVNSGLITGNTSILDYALTLSVGTYEFTINGASYTGGDLPNSNYSYGSVTVYKRASNAITVVLWGFNISSALVPVFNQYGSNGWSGWKHFFTSDGGTLEGNYLGVADHYGYIYANGDETKLGAHNTHEKSPTDERALTIRTSAETELAKAFYFNDKVGGENTDYFIYGEHNKPTVQYIGNGSTTERKIKIGGIGNGVLITSGNGMALVTPYGAICKKPSETTVTGLSWSDIMLLNDGYLKIKSSNDFINKTGGVYTIQTL